MPGHVTPHDMILRQPPRTVKKEGAGIGLPYDVRHEMALMLDDHQQIQRAHDLMDFGTVEVLEEVLRDREDLGYHLFSVLEDDTLVRGMEHLVKEKENIAGDGVVNNNNKLQ